MQLSSIGPHMVKRSDSLLGRTMPFKDGFLLAGILVSVWREFAYFAPRIGLKALFALPTKTLSDSALPVLDLNSLLCAKLIAGHEMPRCISALKASHPHLSSNRGQALTGLQTKLF